MKLLGVKHFGCKKGDLIEPSCYFLQSHPAPAGPTGETDHRPVVQEVGQHEEKVQGERPNGGLIWSGAVRF